MKANFGSLILFLIAVTAQDLVPYLKGIGGTFCKYLALKSQIPRNFFNDCEKPTCHWDSWQDARSEIKDKEKERYVVSYAHNGFGNQLWQHTIAFMIAESLKAKLYIAIIPDTLSPDGVTPPNTFTGMAAMERLLPSQFLYQTLPANSSIRQICDEENFFLADRPRDWRNGTYSSGFKSNLIDIIKDKNPRCIKMLGYFQNLPLCADDAKQLWTPRMFTNFTVKPGPNDISIYLRCVPRHYFFNDRNYYETILNQTTFDRVWLFQAPECPTRLSNDPAKDGAVAAVMRLLTTKFNATRWPAYNGTDDTSILLHDLAGLSQSKKLILPVSSWAQWAGLLSSATEIHVNMPPHHPVMPDMPQFIYHNEKTKQFFGRYSNITKEVEFDSKSTSSTSPREVAKPTTITESALSTASPSSASTLPAQSTAAETFPQTSPVASPVNVTIPLSPEEKESLSQNRSNGTTAAMWWWQDMRIT